MTRVHSRRRRRGGKSIVEIVVVLAVVSTVLLFIGKVTVGVLRTEAQASNATHDGRTLDRLGARFRDDVRNARRIRLLEGDDRMTGLELEGRDGIVEYWIDGGSVKRVVGPERGAIATHEDRFRLGVVEIDFHASANRTTVGVAVHRTVGETADARRFVWRTEARPRLPNVRVEAPDRSEEDR